MDLSLTAYMEGVLQQTVSAFHRYMYSQVSWQTRMFGLVGPRGVGKSTMILQYIKEHRDSHKMFYASADHLYFSSHTLVELVDEFAKEGIKIVYFPYTKGISSTKINEALNAMRHHNLEDLK